MKSIFGIFAVFLALFVAVFGLPQPGVFPPGPVKPLINRPPIEKPNPDGDWKLGGDSFELNY